jgi:hypothetical protein
VEGLSKHKWPVAVASLILVLTLGAVAWAATDGRGGAAEDELLVTPALDPAGDGLGLTGFGGLRWLDRPAGRAFGPGHFKGEVPQELREKLQDRRRKWDERRVAFLHLIREKMSSGDQEKLDQLLEQLQKDREALEQAREKARETGSQLRDLVSKYVPVGEAGSESTTTSTMRQ